MELPHHEKANPSTFIAPLQSFSRLDRGSAGGKGANLGELVRSGFPVPPGFVVTTAAYDTFVRQKSLSQIIAQALRVEPVNGAAIRSAFQETPIPTEIEQEIRSAYRQLGQGPVAVRSSATAEDLPQAAFAGQQDTYLNVIGEQAVLEAVRRCWASLWSDRAISYRQRQGVDQEQVKLAAVVQRMVEAESAGVMFTANPVTGRGEEVVIDASPGLGEAVVSGLVTPDHFVLQKRGRTWRVSERRLGRGELIIRSLPEGGTERLAGAAVAQTASLSERQLRQLRRLGEAIQEHFGSPQDVEWAWAEGRPFILQARPITALPRPLPPVNRLQRLLASTFAEMFPVRPYPLDLDTWIPALAGAIEPMFAGLGLDLDLKRMFQVEDGVVLEFRPTLPRPTWRILLAALRLFANILRYRPRAWQADPLLGEAQTRARQLEALDPATLSWDQILKIVLAEKEIPWYAGELRWRYFPRAAFAIIELRALLAMLGHANQLGALMWGAENKTIEANRELEQLARRVRYDPFLAQAFSTHEPQELWSVLEEQPAGREFLMALRSFLDRYGHREAIISTSKQPTWKDAPETVLGIVKSFSAQEPDSQAVEPGWQAVQAELLQHPLLRFAPIRSAFWQVLADARSLLQIREDTHFYATLPLPILRRMFLEFGKRLAHSGMLEDAEDVYHLTLGELEQLNGEYPPPDLARELRATIQRRKDARAGLEGAPLIDPRLFAKRAPVGEAYLQGMPGSPGVAEGPARIVRDGSEFDKLRMGDVLVAPYTNPSWTPLFQRAAAVVVDSGSAGSHAAIVAREYGIPAVMSTVTGTRKLRDGEFIRVDGNQGLVFQATAPNMKPTGKA